MTRMILMNIYIGTLTRADARLGLFRSARIAPVTRATRYNVTNEEIKREQLRETSRGYQMMLVITMTRFISHD